MSPDQSRCRPGAGTGRVLADRYRVHHRQEMGRAERNLRPSDRWAGQTCRCELFGSSAFGWHRTTERGAQQGSGSAVFFGQKDLDRDDFSANKQRVISSRSRPKLPWLSFSWSKGVRPCKISAETVFGCGVSMEGVPRSFCQAKLILAHAKFD